MLKRQKFYRLLGHNSRGFSLIEVLLAIAVMGIIGVAFLGALSTSSVAILIADERTTAESLARSQMESIKNELYINYSENPHAVYNEIDYPGYGIDLTVEPFDPDTGVPYTETGGIFEQDDGIQKITVTVIHQGKPGDVIILEGYKVAR